MIFSRQWGRTDECVVQSPGWHEKKMMTIVSKTAETFTVRFTDEGSEVRLELINETEQTLRSVDILTVFLKDEDTPGGGPSRVHISFKSLDSIRPKEKVVISHKTWIDGKPAAPAHDQLARLKVAAGETKPYVLDISWEDAEGKTRFQRVPVGH
jgi:hypothetical protein